jgi:hypothetical protein
MPEQIQPGMRQIVLGALHLAIQCHNIFLTCVGEGSEFLSFKKGDLIVLGNERGEDVMTSGWCYGECVRTQAKGDFPAECVYVLPTLRKPPAQVLVCNFNVCVRPRACCLLLGLG